jgi:hypothetical protein
VVKVLDGAWEEVKRFVELLCVVGTSRRDEEELTALDMAIEEGTLSKLVDTGTLINVEELGGGGRNTDVAERDRVDVVGADLLVDVVDLEGGTTRVDDVRSCVDLDVVVEASSETSAFKSLPSSSVHSPTTSFRSKNCPMTLGDGFKALCRSANPGRVKLETTFEVSST